MSKLQAKVFYTNPNYLESDINSWMELHPAATIVGTNMVCTTHTSVIYTILYMEV